MSADAIPKILPPIKNDQRQMVPPPKISARPIVQLGCIPKRECTNQYPKT